MPYTVGAAFNQFLSTIRTSASEVSEVSSHRASIEACLKSNFGDVYFYRIGSHVRTTSIGGFSDVDFLAWFPSAVAWGISSRTFITKVRNALAQRYPNTVVRADGQAVVIRFRQGQRAAEVVPALLSSVLLDGGIKYRIPDGEGGWLYTSPTSHQAYINRIEDKCYKTMKVLARVLKTWKYYKSVPIASFYLEMLTAKCSENGGTISLPYGLKTMFSNLKRRNLAALQDPVGISGYIKACSTDAQKEAALTKVTFALDHSSRAYKAEQDGDYREAIRQWGIVFGYMFPGYG